MTAEDPNWKNVGNWHWREKNCIAWSKEYLTQNLSNLEAKNGDVHVKVTGVESIDGDAALHVRKGKLITIFDIKLTLKWSGQCEPEITATGTIQVPEIAHDTDEDDIVFHITVDNEIRSKDRIKEIVRKGLTKKIKKVLIEFGKELTQANSTDVYIENAKKSVEIQLASVDERRIDLSETPFSPSVPTILPVSPSPSGAAKPDSISTASKASLNLTPAAPTKPATKRALSTTEIKHSTEFVAPPSDIFAAFIDPQRVQIWSQGGLTEGTVGGKVNLFAGMVEGTIEMLDRNVNQVSMKWRLKEWPSDHYSNVTITLSPTSSSTIVNLKQTGVPSSSKEKTLSVWNDWYFRRMKGVFGWGGF